jgi:hypothetical protein
VKVFKVPRLEGISEAQIISIETLDEVLNSALGMHFLGEIIETMTVIRARPKLIPVRPLA